MIPNYPEFKPIDLTIKDTIATFLSNYSPTTCELSLGNIYAWSNIDCTQVTLINENLCFLLKTDDESIFFLEPIGKNLIVKTINACLTYAGCISLVSTKFLQQINSQDQYKIIELRDQFDYVFLTQKQAELKGSKFNAKRNHIHKFKNNYPDFKVHAIDSSFAGKAQALFAEWAQDHNTDQKSALASTMQKCAIQHAFANFACCSFAGLYVEARGRILGFIMGSPLNHNTFLINFQYGLRYVSGIYQFMLQKFCQRLQTNYKYINLEQDLGLPGLRKMKLSYHPDKIEKKHEITFRDYPAP